MENLMINMIDEVLDIQEEEKEVWKVKDDLEADWCLDKIRESKAEYNRFEMVAKAKIQQIEEALKKEREKMEQETSFFESKLREYFEADKHENMQEYIKMKKDFDWAEFKKKLDINGNHIIDKETGEIVEIEGLKLETKPEEFKVEV
ncbi:host-nuclease inhibitor Gam family protein [Sporanaerobacter acetigenes]|uniref:Bacteriophage Mu Gam like protein n=1 Tax=Sporanaerobacter acetigenes DSM 13106 TaxID=1123281 RepID=A0A1M5U2V1_9FIRM|nr:host-nuclease inhibitor Gam family protein [Sporanaerobacter acetigenes]SHH57191.1 Bacteriophage Mu Gam like protein [Sporanaerobacter acetigenes DSM 13106]